MATSKLQLPGTVQFEAGVSLTPTTPGFACIGSQLEGGVSITFTTGSPDWPSAENRPIWNGGTSTLSWTDGEGVRHDRVLSTVGSVNSSSDGQIIEGLNILGPVRIRHDNVTFRQCRVFAPEAVLVAVDNATKTGIVVEDVLIDGTSIAGTNGWRPEGGGGSIIRRCNITGCENAVQIGENAMQVLDCWMHDLFVGGASHTDGIQGNGGYTSLLIEGNAIYSADTSCVIMQNEGGGFSGLVANSNLLVMAPGSACFVCRDDKGAGNIGATTFTNNYLGKPAGGTYNDIQWGHSPGPLVYTGNVDYLTGAPVAQGD